MAIPSSKSRVVPVHGKEHQLVASQPIAAGEIILAESPLLSVPVGRYAWGTYGWDLVDKLLTDRVLLQQYDRWKLAVTEFLLDPQDLAAERALMQKHRLSRQRVRTLYFSVSTNNIGILDDERRVVGYGLYQLLSRSDHSCEPTASLARHDDQNGGMALIARRDLSASEPITWTYFNENGFLQADYETRNFNLLNSYRFVCRCDRCRSERPPHLAEVRDLVGYFDALIKKTAMELAHTPEGRAQVMASTPMEMHRQALRRMA